MQLPPGYQLHPQNPEYMWNPSNNDVRKVPTPQAAPPIPPAPQAAPQAAMPAAQPSYGTVDVSALADDGGVFGKGHSRRLWLNIPKGEGLGTTHLLARLLPPWRPDLHIPYVKYAQHRLPAALVPNAGDRQAVYVICFDTHGGPGHCPVCAACRDCENGENANTLKQYRARPQYVWQGLNLEKLDDHFRQRIDPATQQAVIDANGQYVYDVVPGILQVPTSLHGSIITFFQEPEKGDATHPETGYAMKLKRTKTGSGRLDVEYTAMDMAKSPLDPQLKPVLANLIDLQAEMVKFHSAEEMAEMARNIRQQYGASPVVQGYAPGYAPAPIPAAPPAYQPPMGAPAPAPMPQAPPAPMPMAAPVPLPPPTAPGGIPTAAPAVAHPDVPPAPPPPPGVPGGLPTASGQSPDQFENGLATGNKLPF